MCAARATPHGKMPPLPPNPHRRLRDSTAANRSGTAPVAAKSPYDEGGLPRRFRAIRPNRRTSSRLGHSSASRRDHLSRFATISMVISASGRREAQRRPAVASRIQTTQAQLSSRVVSQPATRFGAGDPHAVGCLSPVRSFNRRKILLMR